MFWEVLHFSNVEGLKYLNQVLGVLDCVLSRVLCKLQFLTTASAYLSVCCNATGSSRLYLSRCLLLTCLNITNLQ